MQEGIPVSGQMRLTVFNADGSVAEERSTKNIMCSAGLTVLVQAINWSGVEDQNTNMGSPFTTTYAAPVLAALGSGTTAVAASDSGLTTEFAFSDYDRATVSAAGTASASGNALAGSTGATVIWSFFWSTSASNWTINEAGVFVQATQTTGSLLDHALINPAVTKLSTQTALLQVTFSFGN